MTTPIEAVRGDPKAIAQLRERLMTEIVEPLRESEPWQAVITDLMAKHDLSEALARVLASTELTRALDFLVAVESGQAFAHGTALRALATAQGFATNTGLTRKVPEIRRIARAQMQADAVRKPYSVGRGPEGTEGDADAWEWSMLVTPAVSNPLHTD